MTASLEFSVEESTETVPGNFNSEGPRAQYQNIGVIVAARKSGIGRAVTEGCTDKPFAVRRYRHADASATDQYAPFRTSIADRRCEHISKIRIID